jgi:hypothetical protein
MRFADLRWPSTEMASPLSLTSAKRGPRSRTWYEACVRHALRNYSRPHVLRRNPLTVIANELHLPRGATGRGSDVAALRFILNSSVRAVIDTADEADRVQLTIMLQGVMKGRTIQAIARELSMGREWLHKTWWPEAVRATTSVLIEDYLLQRNSTGASSE